MLHLTMECLMPVITASPVICSVSRHDGYLCTGHLSFPPRLPLPRFMLSLSFFLGLLVICPAWVDLLKVSCFTLTTHTHPLFLYLEKILIKLLLSLPSITCVCSKSDKFINSSREVTTFTYKNFFSFYVAYLFL